MIAELATRLKHSLLTWPKADEWISCIGISVAALIVMGALAWGFGLVRWQPDTQGWPLRLLGVMVVPALSEEALFRGVLIPTQGGSRHAVRWIAAGLLAFILWHVVEALTFLPGARLFLEPGFLICVAILGAACALMRYRTGSLWPAVLLHGLVVFVWQVWLGGPSVAELI